MTTTSATIRTTLCDADLIAVREERLLRLEALFAGEAPERVPVPSAPCHTANPSLFR
jgi:hypothetical protein